MLNKQLALQRHFIELSPRVVVQIKVEGIGAIKISIAIGYKNGSIEIVPLTINRQLIVSIFVNVHLYIKVYKI